MQNKFRAYYFPKLPIFECTPDYVNRKWDDKKRAMILACREIIWSIKTEGLRDPILGVIKDYRRDGNFYWEVTGGERRWMCAYLMGWESTRFILRFDELFWEHEAFKSVFRYEHVFLNDVEDALSLCLTEGDKVPNKIILKRWWR